MTQHLGIMAIARGGVTLVYFGLTRDIVHSLGVATTECYPTHLVAALGLDVNVPKILTTSLQ
jgi:hypothetical protein